MFFFFAQIRRNLSVLSFGCIETLTELRSPRFNSKMAGSLLLPLVRGVASKAASVLVQTVTRMCGLDDDRDMLELHLLAVERKLARADERSETDLAVKHWMKKLRAVAYEADDVLDEFEYEALRRKYQIGESKKRKVLSYITLHSPLLFRFAMSTKLKNILQKIRKLVEEMNMFGLENSALVEEPRLPFRQTHSKLDECSTIYGREDDQKVIAKLLLDQRGQIKVQVLPIFGMGGLGKTTLAKMVYNDQGIQQHFQLKMWHCVSDNFDVISLVKSIIELATDGRCNLPDNMELLQRRLEEVIGKKRFILVLDDVWNEDERKWEDDLKPLLCSVGGSGSVIVVTCRSQKVASVMQTLGPHKLACLNEEDSWELFAEKAFSSGVEEQAELVTIGRRIVKKCRGLPLALKTIGGLLSSYQQVQQWKAIEESNIRDNVRGKDEILPILKLSYKHLSSEMKQCFAFCAVFPKDYVMYKDELIQLWIANGFVQEEGTMDLTQKGELIFHNLVWRSFLEDFVVDRCMFLDRTTHDTSTCKMHDLMHDLAKDVTDECASIKELNQQKALLKDVCHIEMSEAKPKQIHGLFKGKTHLRSLLGSPTSNINFKELSLRALSFHGYCVMNYYGTDLKHLRYLDISYSSIIALPDSICLLYNLQTLRLISCGKLVQLPEDMIRLINLIYLYLSGCICLESMSPNFGLLNNLHILTTFVVGTGDGLGIEQLKDLQHLGNRLDLLNLSKVKSGENAKEANLHQKHNLKELLFSWDQEIDDVPKDKACYVEVLQCLEPHSNIEKLEVRGYGGLEVSQWMRKPEMFNCLRELTISNCPRCKNIPVVWLSVSLQVLSLSKMDKLTTLCNNLDVEAGGCITSLQTFPKLTEMSLKELPSLETWAENSVGEGSDRLTKFPMLEELYIANCPKLASVPVIPVIKVLSITGVCSIAVDLVSTSILLGSWPFLVRLIVESENNMAMLPLDVQQSQSPRPLEKLEKLILKGPNCMVAAADLSGPHLTLWRCFALVEELEIIKYNDLIHWPTDQLRCLDRLRSSGYQKLCELGGE
uniref:Uncharacterized protein n=4 Tax=Avena sativa TaxID=4498 RepID=A0ACD5TL25_AVESA